MNYIDIILITSGLILFEVISSIDNAIINAEVLSTMKPKYRNWFLVWGIFFAVFVVRGILPWLIVWATAPHLGFIGSLTATFSSDPHVHEIIEQSAPILLLGGGIFLVFLFLNWLFLEEKNFCARHEKFFIKQGVWFYSTISIFLSIIIRFALSDAREMLAFGAVLGSTGFFIVSGFKHYAELQEKNLTKSNSGLSDISKIIYLEILDATFSVDGVLGAFAFTLSVPLILLGNGIGAFVVRELTIHNIDRIKKFKYLKNGAMYSILVLGIIMVLKAFNFELPEWVSPIVTFIVIGYFFYISWKDIKKLQV